jgi:hypothetical protein
MPSESVPTFSTARVSALFGYSTANPVMRWIETGRLEATSNGGSGKSARWSVAPAALLAFVRAHPNDYDWRRIGDPRLKDEARKVDERDPLVPVDELVKTSPATLPELAAMAKRGVFALVRRQSGGRGGGKVSYWVRKSAIGAAAAAIEEARRREDPLFALHSLLDAERPTSAPLVATRVQPAGAAEAQSRVTSVAAMPARRCPKCGARMMRTWADELSNEAIDKCLSCGEEVAVEPGAGEAVNGRSGRTASRATA